MGLVVVGVYFTNIDYFHNYRNNYIDQKQAVMQYYLEKRFSDLESGYRSHAYWDNQPISVDMTSWQAVKSMTHILESEVFSTDYIMVADETLDFVTEQGNTLSKRVLALDVIKNSIADNQTGRAFTKIDEHYWFMVYGPMIDQNKQNPWGVYVIASQFNGDNNDDIKKYLGGELTELTITESNAALPVENANQNIGIQVPIAETAYTLSANFFVDDTMYHLSLLRNRNFALIIIIGSSVIVIIIVLLYYMSKRIRDVDKAVQAIAEGDYDIHLPIQEADAMTEINNLSRLVNTVASRLSQMMNSLDGHYLEMIDVILRAVAINDPYTAEHNDNVAIYAQMLGETLQFTAIDELVSASKLHDIGKIGVPADILNKPTRLTELEYAQVKKHPQIGYDIIKHFSYFDTIKLGVRHHHEHWDGGGYPDGLSGEAIPFIAQIICLADVYEALTTDRPYRTRMSHDQAAAIIFSNSGKMFNPQVVEAFKARMDDFKKQSRA